MPVRLPRLPWPLARRKRTALGLAPLLAITLAAIVLVVSLGRLVAVAYVAGNAAETTLGPRLSRGLAATAGFLNDERTRTLLAAEAAASVPSLSDVLVAQDPTRALAQVQAARKTAAPSLLALVDENGRVLAADPATNLPLAQDDPVKQALRGTSAVTLAVDSGNLAFLAAAPIEQNGHPIGAAIALQRIDDTLLTDALRDSGLSGALLFQDHVLAATSLIRTRYTQNRNQPVALHPAPTATGQPAQLVVGQTTFVVASRALSFIGADRGVTLVVGEQARDGGLFALTVRTPLLLEIDLGSALGATLLAGAIGWLIGKRIGRSLLDVRDGADRVSPLAGREVRALASALAAEHAAAASREAATAAEAGQLRAVLDAVGEGIIVSDRDRRVVLTNLAARSFLGLNGAGPTGEVIALLPPPRSSAEIRANARVLRSYSAPIASADGVLGVVTVLHDSTGERESERLQSEFLSVVSHELQTPLTAIVGAADLLLDDEQSQLNAEQMRFVSAIRRNGDRLIGLVNDLLDVSRLEAGRVELDPQPVDLGALARSSLRALTNLFDQKDQTVTLNLPGPDDGPLPPVLGDRRRLEQILANLLANAAQYTQASGHVWLEARPVGAEVILTVADDGPGISAGDQAHIFDKFYRGRSAAGRRERGSGLGLAIVRSLVELHGGRIWVESAPGQGARFSVALPAASGGDD